MLFGSYFCWWWTDILLYTLCLPKKYYEKKNHFQLLHFNKTSWKKNSTISINNNLLGSVRTIFVCKDVFFFAFGSTSFYSRGRHKDSIFCVLIESCQISLSCWSINDLGLWTLARKRCVLNCVTQYYAISVTSWWNLVPLNKNTGGTCVVSADIFWRICWFCNNVQDSNKLFIA